MDFFHDRQLMYYPPPSMSYARRKDLANFSSSLMKYDIEDTLELGLIISFFHYISQLSLKKKKIEGSCPWWHEFASKYKWKILLLVKNKVGKVKNKL